MSDTTSKGATLWQDLKMPPLTHCSVQRACELLNLKKTDILNWSHKLRPVVMLNRSIMKLKLVLTVDREELENITGEELITVVSIFAEEQIEILRPFTEKTMFLIGDGKARIIFESTAYICGAIHLLDGIVIDSENNVELSIPNIYGKVMPDKVGDLLGYFDDNLCSCADIYVESLQSYNQDNQSVLIPMEEIYISGMDLEKIYEAGKIGADLDQINQSGIENTLINDRSGNLTVHQFHLIYALLKIAGVTDEDIKEGTPTNLNRKLADIGKEKGVKVPQPDKNTWKKWKEKLESVMR